MVVLLLLSGLNNGLLIQYGIYPYPEETYDRVPLTIFPIVFNCIYGIFTQCLTTGEIGSSYCTTSAAWTTGSCIFWNGETSPGNYDLRTGFVLGASGVINYYMAIGY